MIICVCMNYRTKDLVSDLRLGKSLKSIIQDNGIDKSCKKCCQCIKKEYLEINNSNIQKI